MSMDLTSVWLRGEKSGRVPVAYKPLPGPCHCAGQMGFRLPLAPEDGTCFLNTQCGRGRDQKIRVERYRSWGFLLFPRAYSHPLD